MVESSGILRDSDLRGDGIRPYAQISRLAVLSLVLNVLIVTFPLTIVLGIMAVRRIRASKGAVAGLPVAIAGIVVGLALAAGVGVYHVRKTAARSRAIAQSEAVLLEFFDFTRRGYADDAWARVTPEGRKQLARDQIEQLRGLLKAVGKVKSVSAGSVVWRRGKQRGLVAEMIVTVETETRPLYFKVVTAEVNDRWLIDSMGASKAPNQQRAEDADSHGH